MSSLRPLRDEENYPLTPSEGHVRGQETLFTSDESDINLREYLGILRRRWPSLLLSVVLCLLAGILYVTRATPIYSSGTTVQLDEGNPNRRRGGDLDAIQAMVDLQQGKTIETQVEVLKSANIRHRAYEYLQQNVSAYYTDLLLDQASINVQRVKQADIVLITVEHPSPKVAQEFANAISQVYVDWTKLLNRLAAGGARVFLES